MNRQQAIEWCRLKGYNDAWVNSTKHEAPDGWRWVIHPAPYDHTEYYLLNNAGTERIKQVDIE